MTKTNKQEIIKYLLEDLEIVKELVSECNSYDGSLEEYVYHVNDEEFFNIFFNNNPDEAVRATFYGDYRYTDDYVQFNGYGNLVSVSEWQVEEELKNNVEEIFETWFELYGQNNVDTYNDGLKELLEA